MTEIMLTEEQLKKFKIAFDKFDANKNGVITIEELCELMVELGHTDITEEEADNMMIELDEDESGDIDFAEFLSVMVKRLMFVGNEEEIIAAFKVFDKNEDGVIDSNELKTVLSTLGQRLTLKDCEELVSAADSDHDGQINYREFAKLLST